MSTNLTLTSAATQAAQLLGVLDSGESLSTQQIADALLTANNLLDNYSSEQVMIPAITRSTQALTTGQQAYTIAPAPLAITGASLMNSSGPGAPVEVCNEQKWTSIPDRQRLSYLVTHLFYDRRGNYYVSPVPQGASLTLELLTWAALTQFADATTPIAMPAGYARPFIAALAVEMAPAYDQTPSGALQAAAADAMARIRNLNAELFGGEAPAGQAGAVSGAPIKPNGGAQ